MTEIATAASWFLAVVLFWAAGSKVRDLRGAATTFRQLGVALPASVVVSLEVGVAILLLARPRLGGCGALLLLGGFTVVVVRAIRQPEPTRCSCFGSSSNDPVDVSTLLRNVLLLCVAALALGATQPEPSIPGLIAVSTMCAAGILAHALCRLRLQVGRVFPAIVGDRPVARDRSGQFAQSTQSGPKAVA